MKITLIRHTDVEVEKGICYGQSNVNVAATFECEARSVKEKLNCSQFDAVFCSPLSRCTKLADYCGILEPIIDDRLMEMNFGDWEMKAWDNINDPHLQTWYADWVNQKATNGESFMELMCRVQNFQQEICKMNLKHIAIFTHAGVIRSFFIINKFISIQNSFKFMINYADIVEIDTHQISVLIKKSNKSM